MKPIRKTMNVSWDPERAFRRFTDEIGSWWPLRSHSVGGERADGVVLEGRVGGRIVEKIRGGEESVWGTLTTWDPPRRVAFTWHPGQAEAQATNIEVTFAPVAGGTRLTLVHSSWEALGPLAALARRGYPIGWAYVLRLWAGRGSSLLVRVVHALEPLMTRLARRAEAKARRKSATA